MPSSHIRVLASREVIDYLERLEPDHKHIKWINEMKKKLQQDPYCGEKIRKNRIPRYYKERYSVKTLFRYAHPEGYRSIYTLLMRVRLTANHP